MCLFWVRDDQSPYCLNVPDISCQVLSLNVQLCPSNDSALSGDTMPWYFSLAIFNFMNCIGCLFWSFYLIKSVHIRLFPFTRPAHIHCCLSPVPTMPLFSVISSRPQLHVFVKSVSPLPSTPGSDQCSFSRSLVMWRAEPLGATGSHWEPGIFLFSLCRRSQPHLQLNHPPPATPSRHRIWSSHLAFRHLPSHSVPRVPEDAGERQGKIVSWLPARGKRGKVFEIFNSEAVSLERGGFVLFYIWCW